MHLEVGAKNICFSVWGKKLYYAPEENKFHWGKISQKIYRFQGKHIV